MELQITDENFGPRNWSLGERLLGNTLRKVLIYCGALDEKVTGGATIINVAEAYVKSPNEDKQRFRIAADALRETLSDLEHIKRNERTKECFCKDLDNGEHAVQPACSWCVLNGRITKLKALMGAK